MGRKKPKTPEAQKLSPQQLAKLEKQYMRLVSRTNKTAKEQNRLLSKEQRIIANLGQQDKQFQRDQIALQREQFQAEKDQIAKQESLQLAADQVGRQQQRLINAQNRIQLNLSSAQLDKQQRSLAFRNRGIINSLLGTSLR